MPLSRDTSVLHYKYRLIIQNDDGVRCAFDYYGSNEEFEEGKYELDGPTLLFAFLCVLNDAMESLRSLDTWMYTNAPGINRETAESVYNSLQTIWPKLEKLGIQAGFEMDAMMTHLHENS